jgi:hypothetical protein
MDSTKTLAARQTIVGYSRANDCWFVKVFPYESEGDAKAAAADALDRLSAPDVGVGLTRYFIFACVDDDDNPYEDCRKSSEGEWVRFEDVAPLLAAARAVPADVKLADLIAALENGTQADEDGVMVTVSRQACHEAAKILKARQRKVLPDPLQPKCQHCNDTGLVAINATTGIYARPGPVPDDARGYAEAPCWECNVYPGGFDGPTGAD